jgi:hypothetical protein
MIRSVAARDAEIASSKLSQAIATSFYVASAAMTDQVDAARFHVLT